MLKIFGVFLLFFVLVPIFLLVILIMRILFGAKSGVHFQIRKQQRNGEVFHDSNPKVIDAEYTKLSEK